MGRVEMIEDRRTTSSILSADDRVPGRQRVFAPPATGRQGQRLSAFSLAVGGGTVTLDGSVASSDRAIIADGARVLDRAIMLQHGNHLLSNNVRRAAGPQSSQLE